MKMGTGRIAVLLFAITAVLSCGKKRGNETTDPRVAEETSANGKPRNADNAPRPVQKRSAPSLAPVPPGTKAKIESRPLEPKNHADCQSLGKVEELSQAARISLAYQPRSFLGLANGQLKCQWVGQKATRKLPSISADIQCENVDAAYTTVEGNTTPLAENEAVQIGSRGFKRMTSAHGYLFGIEAGGCFVQIKTIHLPAGTENAAADIIARWVAAR
jgi:hypothetical protein